MVRIDPFAQLPNILFKFSSGFCRVGTASFTTEDISAIYCRVALEALNARHSADPVADFAASEHFAALLGILSQVPKEKWINYPWQEAVVDGKIYPLVLAAEAGILVPDFIVASEVTDLLEFANREPRTVVKPLSDKSIAWQNGSFVTVPDLAAFDAVYTADFDTAKLLSENFDESTPTLVQRKIEKLGDIRATVIDDAVLATLLERDHAYVDSRLV